MRFDFTPDEAQTLAGIIIKYFRRNKYNIAIERPVLHEAPCRTTLIAEKDGVKKLIDCQSAVNYGILKQLAQWLAARRLNCELYIGTHEESSISSGEITALRKDGVGLIVINDGALSVPLEAKNFALIVNIDPLLKLGQLQPLVNRIVTEFNRGGNSNRKAALRDMFELVEGETEKLLLKGIKKNIIVSIREARIKGMDWSSQINYLARPESYRKKAPSFEENLRLDFQSFRGARNLLDHKVSGKKAEFYRQIQYVERMHQGPRLLNVLQVLSRKMK